MDVDPDGDGLTSFEEAILGTNPLLATRRNTGQIDLPTIGTNAFSQPYRRWSFFLSITANVGGALFIGVNGFEPITQTFGNSGNILRFLSPLDLYFKVVKSFALVPLSSVIKENKEIPKEYSGKRLFLISRY